MNNNIECFNLSNQEYNKIKSIREGNFSRYKFISIPMCTGPYFKDKMPNQEYKELALIKRIGIGGYDTDGNFLYIDKHGNLWFKNINEDMKDFSKLQILPNDILNGKAHKIKVHEYWLDLDEDFHENEYSIDIIINIPKNENERKDLFGNIISVNDRVAYAYHEHGGPNIKIGTIIKINDHSLSIKSENDPYNSKIICYSSVIKIDK